jgi:hypothetical protein
MQHANDARRRQTGTYTLDTLHALPCGCVAAVFRTQPLDTEIVSLEARGPHCMHTDHKTGRVLGLSTADEGRLSR